MEKEKKEISRKILIGIIIALIVTLVIAFGIIISFMNNSKPNHEVNNSTYKENNTIDTVRYGYENNDIVLENYEISENSINYIEIEMPNLVGKGYMDILYRYNLKENILNQLYEKDIEGTTFNLNTLKYIGDGSILINGSYVIEGYGYEVEKQTPLAGSKIKLFNDGEGNVSLGEDIHLYIKGGGTTKTIDIDPDKRTNSNSSYNNDDVSTNSYIEDTEPSENKTYSYSVISGCEVIDFDSSSGRISYKQKCENCDWVSSTTKSTYIGFGTISTSFNCPDCKKQQRLSIKGSSN